LTREIRRRTDVVGIFPGRSTIIRLIGAVLAEQQHGEWPEGHRYLRLDVLACCRITFVPDDPPTNDPTTQVTSPSDIPALSA